MGIKNAITGCYIHIPFCKSKCSYCRFASIGDTQKLKIARYIDFLCDKINTTHNMNSIYFGGGTPSTLGINQLEKILRELYFNDNTEITIESTPNNVTGENLIGWKKIGINRLSIGVQSLNNKTLKEIGRGGKGDIIKALDNIEKNKGIINLSIDFIIGLPYVKKGETKKDIEYILDKYSFIKHISVYMLEDHYYPGKWENFSIKEEDYLWEYIEVKQFLESRGFNRYEISNFAISGYECRHNQFYWNHSDIVAYGLGASGYEKGFRYSNSDKFSEYYNSKNIFKEKLSKQDIFLEKVMFGLRTNGLIESIYKKLDLSKIEDFINNGYLFIDNKKLKLTDKGVLVLGYIMGELI